MTRAFLAAANSCEETMGTVGTGAGDLRDGFASGGAHDRCLQHFNELAEIAESPEWDFGQPKCAIAARRLATLQTVKCRLLGTVLIAALLVGMRIRPAMLLTWLAFEFVLLTRILRCGLARMIHRPAP
jgi:hypothetical protein